MGLKPDLRSWPDLTLITHTRSIVGIKERDDNISCASACTNPVCVLHCWPSGTDRRCLTFDPCFPSNPHSPRQRPEEAISTSFPSLSHFPCFWGSLLPWKECFPAAKCHINLVFSIQQEGLTLTAWPCSLTIHWTSLFLFFEVVLEQFLLYCWGGQDKVSIRLYSELPGCFSLTVFDLQDSSVWRSLVRFIGFFQEMWKALTW